jgi:hypothetical protein
LIGTATNGRERELHMQLPTMRKMRNCLTEGGKPGVGDRRRLLTACLLVLLAAAPAHARRGAMVPISVRIIGCVGVVPAGVRPQATWLLRDRHREYKLQVDQLSVRASGPSALDIDAALSPYDYRLQVAGDQATLDRFRALQPDQRVVIDGLLRLQAGARYLMLTRVEVDAATPSPVP